MYQSAFDFLRWLEVCDWKEQGQCSSGTCFQICCSQVHKGGMERRGSNDFKFLLRPHFRHQQVLRESAATGILLQLRQERGRYIAFEVCYASPTVLLALLDKPKIWNKWIDHQEDKLM